MTASPKQIPGYLYAAYAVSAPPVSLEDLNPLKTSVGMTAADGQSLRLAGEVLKDQTQQIVALWRSGIIAGIQHLSRHSLSPTL